MKRFLAILLVVMLLFSLAACGDNNIADPDKDNPGTSQGDDGFLNRDENNTDDDVGESTNDGSSEGTADSGNTNVLHELFAIQQLASNTAIPEFAKKAIGDLRWCDDLGADSFGKYNYNIYMKEVTQEDFETYVANLTANAPTNSEEGNIFGFYWEWGQITGEYFPDSDTLDVVLTAK